MTGAGLLAPAPAAPGQAAAQVTVLSNGVAAFGARAAAARAARTSLDLQYYIWKADLTGQLLAREALRAADRGVTVRILLDDMNGLGQEFSLAPLVGHPRIRIRRFNGTRWRRWGRTGMLLEMLLGNWHLNRRMHNKAWIADDGVVVCGGRNIGDSYFDASGELNFRDLDLVVQGAAAAPANALFDAYWNHPLARPVRRLSVRPVRTSLARLRRKLEATAASPQAGPYLHAIPAQPAPRKRTLDVPADAIHIISDAPDKARGLAGSAVAPSIERMLDGARREALLVSPYFVPGEAGAARLIALVQAGVHVSVITNSLAATDVVAVHAGYVRYRARLIEAGVEIFEVKHSAEKRAGVFGSSAASLHTKAMLVDGEWAFVGSFNLDHRSINLNTEMGVLVRDRQLGRLMRRQHRWLAQGSRSWRLTMQAGRPCWSDGATTLSGSEPGARLGRRVLARLVGWLPVEKQL